MNTDTDTEGAEAPEAPEVTDREHQLIQSICDRFCKKYACGYMTKEDIWQESYIICLEALPRYNGKYPLENFLTFNLSNRLKNLVRDTYKPNKQNLVNAISLERVSDINESSLHEFCEDFTKVDTNLTAEELVEKINCTLPREYRVDFLKFLNGEKINHRRMATLKKVLRKALRDYDNGH